MKTTLTEEQSADLIKLGVSAEKAGTIRMNFNGTYAYVHGEEAQTIRDCINNQFYIEENNVFTLADLLGLLPKWIKYRNKLLWLNIQVNDYTEEWCAKYNSDYDIDEADTFQSAEELVDCLYLLLKHLIKEKLILL